MKKITFRLLLPAMLYCASVQAQGPMFANATPAIQPGLATNDYARDVKQISNNEYVVVGARQDAPAAGGFNGYLNYYSSTGILQRSVTISSNTGDEVWGVDALIITPTTADIYITGFFTGTATVTLTAGLTTTPLGVFAAPSGNTGDVTCFLAKFNEAGNLIWFYTTGNMNNTREEGHDITVERLPTTRLVYITGMLRGATTFNSAGPSLPLTSTGTGDDAFVASYRDNGINATINWVNLISGSNAAQNDIGKAIDADELGNVYVTGGYKGAFGTFSSTPPAPAINNVVSYGNDDAFVVRYDINGAAVAATAYGSSLAGPAAAAPAEQGRGISVTGSNGLVYVSGYYIGYNVPATGSFGASAFTGVVGGYEGFLVGMKATSLLAGFYRTIRSVNDDFCYKMDVDPAGAVLTTGSFGALNCNVFDDNNTSIYTQAGCLGGSTGFVMRHIPGTGAAVLGTVCGGNNDAVTAIDGISNFSYICGQTMSTALTFEGSATTITNAGAPNWDGFSASCMHFSLLRQVAPLSVSAVNASVFPNPTSGRLTIQIDEKTAENPSQLILLDLSGRTVLTQQITQTQTEISVTDLPAGVYVWRISGQNGVINQDKLIIAD